MYDKISEDHNILFVTLDSCRWDTYLKANTPNFDRLGIAKKAQTHGNYTLPAHMSFFCGHLPSVMDDSREAYYTKDGAQLWRLSSAKKRKMQVGVSLEGHTIQQGYRKKGFQLRGFGGVGYFLKPEDLLRRDYLEEEFVHYGGKFLPDAVHVDYPRESKVLPFSHIDEIVESANGKDNWFIFINAVETHIPYQTKSFDNERLVELINYSIKYRNGRTDPDVRFDYESGGKELHQLQVDALEFVDTNLGQLLDGLPKNKPLLFVMCGDHGELFGEKGYWGHILNQPEVLSVPLLINPDFKFE